MNVYRDIRHFEYKHIKTAIPQVKATHFNKALNIFYYPYTDKTSDTNLTVYLGRVL